VTLVTLRRIIPVHARTRTRTSIIQACVTCVTGARFEQRKKVPRWLNVQTQNSRTASSLASGADGRAAEGMITRVSKRSLPQ
jgi:hypothetical protein